MLRSRVDGGTGKSEQEGVWEGRTHLHTEIALLGAVGFVDQDNDVVLIVEDAPGLSELMDGGDDHLPGVACE